MNCLFRRQIMNSPDSAMRRGYTRAKSFGEGLQHSISWMPFDDHGEELRGIFDSLSWQTNSFHSFLGYDWQKWQFLNIDPDENWYESHGI